MAMDVSGLQKAHTRQLEINTYGLEPDGAIVVGSLKDECFVTRYLVNGDQRPPGTIHHMIVRMKVRGPSLTIEEVEAEMPTVPRAECRQTIDTLTPLKGMRIASGFTLKVKELLGGPKSCAHMVSLVLAMAPAAVQGAWSAASQKPLDPSIYAERAMGFLTDTCWVWRRGGPMEQSHREELKDYLESK
ncbi:MAG: DUF2889 domain-containing protein [Desulfobacterales bacterium]